MQNNIALVSVILLSLHCFSYIVLRLLGLIRSGNLSLNCGIFGFSGKGDINIVKFLGFSNDSRGGDGCGYYHDKTLHKGFGKQELFKNLILEKKMTLNPECNVFIGHTRKASFGSKITLDNTHPFLIDKTFIFAHNGKVENAEKLCEAYDIDHKGMTVDSHMFGAVLKKAKSFKPLSQYKGAAAISFHDTSEPDVVYLFHGKSSDWASQGESVERPLFVLKTKNCIYWSSLREPLDLIADEGDVVEELDCNVVYKLTKGKIVKLNKVKVDRERSNHYNFDPIKGEPVTYTHQNHNAKQIGYPAKSFQDTFSENIDAWERPYVNQQAPFRKGKTVHVVDNMKKIYNIKHEFIDKGILSKIGTISDRTKLILFFCKGFHQELSPNGTWKLAEGAYYADKDTGDAVSRPEENVNNLDAPSELQLFVPEFEHSVRRYYFHKGMLINSHSYTDFVKFLACTPLKEGCEEYVKTLSNFTTYPIPFYDEKNSVTYHHGVRANANPIKPQFTNRAYTYKWGLLTGIKNVKNDKSKTEDFIASSFNRDETLPKHIIDSDLESKVVIPSQSGAVRGATKKPVNIVTDVENDEIYKMLTRDIMNKSMVAAIDIKPSDSSRHINVFQTYYSTVNLLMGSLTPICKKALNSFFSDICLAMSTTKDVISSVEPDVVDMVVNSFLEECVSKNQTVFASLSGYQVSLLKDYVVCAMYYDFLKGKRDSNSKEVEDDVPSADEQALMDFAEANEQAYEEEMANEQDSQTDMYLDIFVGDIESSGGLRDSALELQEFEASEYAQEVSNVLFKTEEFLLNELTSVLSKYQKTKLINKIKDLQTSKSTI